MTTKKAPGSTFKYRRGRYLLLCSFLGIVHRHHVSDILNFRVIIGFATAHPAGAMNFPLTQHSFVFVVPVIILLVNDTLFLPMWFIL